MCAYLCLYCQEIQTLVFKKTLLVPHQDPHPSLLKWLLATFYCYIFYVSFEKILTNNEDHKNQVVILLYFICYTVRENLCLILKIKCYCITRMAFLDQVEKVFNLSFVLLVCTLFVSCIFSIIK